MVPVAVMFVVAVIAPVTAKVSFIVKFEPLWLRFAVPWFG